MWSLECWVPLSEEAVNELLFGQQLPRLRFETEIWPSQKGVFIKVATDASDFAWGGHTPGWPLIMAREYFTWEESVESSTFRERLGVLRCLQALVHLCKGKSVVVQFDAQNLLGIVNRGSSKLAINKLARDLFWFGLDLSWCSVCATAHIPTAVLVGAYGPSLSELLGSSENTSV